jgi:hypothetical protein
MTQVPSFTDTPRLPEMVGIATLAIDESSTFMKVASATAKVARTSLPPSSGGGGAGAAGAAGGGAAGVGALGGVGVLMRLQGVAPERTRATAGFGQAASLPWREKSCRTKRYKVAFIASSAMYQRVDTRRDGR